MLNHLLALSATALALLCAAPAFGQAATLADEGFQGSLPAGFPAPSLVAAASTSELRVYHSEAEHGQIMVFLSGPLAPAASLEARESQLDVVMRGLTRYAQAPVSFSSPHDSTHLLRDARFVMSVQGRSRQAALRGYVLRTGGSRVVGVLVTSGTDTTVVETPEALAFLDAVRHVTSPPAAGTVFRLDGVQVTTPAGMPPVVRVRAPSGGEPGVQVRSFGSGDGASVASIGITDFPPAAGGAPSPAARRAVLRAFYRGTRGAVRDLEEGPERTTGSVLYQERRFTMAGAGGSTIRVRERASVPLHGPMRLISLSYAQLDGAPMDDARAEAFFESLGVATP